MLDSIQLNFNADSIAVLNVCLAVIMFGVALNLSPDDFKRLIRNPRASIVGILSQFVALPAITFLLVVWLEPAPGIALGMMLVAACPGGNISNFMTHLAQGNTALSISLTAIGTAMTVIATPLNLNLWGSMYPPTAALLREVSLDPLELIKTIMMLAIIPLCLGMLVNARWPTVALRLSRWVKPLSILIFIAFVVIAFANNADVFVNYIGLVFFIVLLHNAAAFTTGYLLAYVSRLSLADQKTIAIETGIQNSGLGLLLIFSFFDGMGSMAMVAAWWGIWHIIAGLLLSGYFATFRTATQSA